MKPRICSERILVNENIYVLICKKNLGLYVSWRDCRNSLASSSSTTISFPYPRVADVDLTTFFFRREIGLVVNLQAFSVELSWYPPDQVFQMNDGDVDDDDDEEEKEEDA